MMRDSGAARERREIEHLTRELDTLRAVQRDMQAAKRRAQARLAYYVKRSRARKS